LAAASPGAQPISALARGAGAATRRELVYALAVPFPAGAAVLTAPARSILDQLTARLNLGDSVFYLEIQGHADASGTDTRNMAIALQRAQAVRDYLLVTSGLPAERLALVSLGAGQPVGDNATPAGRAANRRVVVLVLR
jgi:outer membrane protein OmpA-like peptidoglycan-associated protein